MCRGNKSPLMELFFPEIPRIQIDPEQENMHLGQRLKHLNHTFESASAHFTVFISINLF